MMNTAIITGSFDPITVGHLDIIRRSAVIFDQVVVAVASNSEKNGFLSDEARLRAVEASIDDLNNVSVVICEGLIADFCKNYQNPVIVRGSRNGSDFDYERSLYLINKDFGAPESIILPANNGIGYISSTYARELIKYNKSLENVVPEGAIKVIEEYLK